MAEVGQPETRGGGPVPLGQHVPSVTVLLSATGLSDGEIRGLVVPDRQLFKKRKKSRL